MQVHYRLQFDISIHAPREGGDPAYLLMSIPPNKHFNPRPPRGGRRWMQVHYRLQFDISIHAPREGGDAGRYRRRVKALISIHAPREGGDDRSKKRAAAQRQFQSTPPARGATRHPLAATRGNFLFQSTPPARGATTTRPVSDIARRISIHAPREGGDIVHRMPIHKIPISIHAPREGGDVLDYQSIGGVLYFNPRPPRGGRLSIRVDVEGF